jgi:hypothetical protein
MNIIQKIKDFCSPKLVFSDLGTQVVLDLKNTPLNRWIQYHVGNHADYIHPTKAYKLSIRPYSEDDCLILLGNETGLLGNDLADDYIINLIMEEEKKTEILNRDVELNHIRRLVLG